jgi:hypothetical protein
VRKLAGRSAAVTGLILLAACGGGGGGGSASTLPPAPTIPAPPAPIVFNVAAPASPATGGLTTPSFNFSNNLPPAGTVFPLPGTVARITAVDVTAAGNGQGVTATFRGTATSNGQSFPVFDLDAPTLSLHAPSLTADGSSVTLADGSKVSASIGTLNYSLIGLWAYAPGSGGTSYIGQLASGYLTPLAGVPASGSASYSGTGDSGGVAGIAYISIGFDTVTAGSVTGDAALTIDFASNKVDGRLTNMKAKFQVNGSGTPTLPNIFLTGSLSRSASGTSLTGTTNASTAFVPGSDTWFTEGAAGNFAASLYGPNAQEVGGAWTLYQPSAGGNKAAVGTFLATKQ